MFIIIYDFFENRNYEFSRKNTKIIIYAESHRQPELLEEDDVDQL